jgi:hypothetical protein
VEADWGVLPGKGRDVYLGTGLLPARWLQGVKQTSVKLATHMHLSAAFLSLLPYTC